MPPRARFSLSVSAITMVKSASAARLIQILRPLITQSSPSPLGARDHAGGIAAGAGLGDGDRRNRLAAHIGLEIGVALALVHRRHQHAQVRRVRRQRVGRDGPASSSLTPISATVGRSAPPMSSGASRPQRPSSFETCVDADAVGLVDAEPLAGRLAREHAGLERHQLVGDEARHEILEHAMLFGDLEIHTASPRLVLPLASPGTT